MPYIVLSIHEKPYKYMKDQSNIPVMSQLFKELNALLLINCPGFLLKHEIKNEENIYAQQCS